MCTTSELSKTGSVEQTPKMTISKGDQEHSRESRSETRRDILKVQSGDKWGPRFHVSTSSVEQLWGRVIKFWGGTSSINSGLRDTPEGI